MNPVCTSLASVFLTVALVFAAALPPEAIKEAPQPGPEGVEALVNASVLVVADGSKGSGFCYRNGRSYIWTAAHVVVYNLVESAAEDPETGEPVKHRSFSKLTLVQHVYKDMVKVGTTERLASVIRYADMDDLALLVVDDDCWPTSSVTFAPADYRPRLGEAVWHVGSMHGDPGINSLTDGVISAIGRLRENRPYDQMSVPCHPGCSGGGIFRKGDNKCIALLNRTVSRDAGSGSILCRPSRAIREFAVKAKCQWAVDGGPVPAVDDAPLFQD